MGERGVSKIVGVEGMTWGQSWERASYFTEIPSIVAGVRWGCRAGEERSDQGQMAFVPSYIYIWELYPMIDREPLKELKQESPIIIPTP